MARMTPAESSSARNGLLARTYPTTRRAKARTNAARPAQPAGLGRKRSPLGAYGSAVEADTDQAAGRRLLAGGQRRQSQVGATEEPDEQHPDGDEGDHDQQ